MERPLAKRSRDDVLKIYDRLIAGTTGFERKGKTTPYTSINGNMCSFVDPDGQLCLRFSDRDLAAFQERFAAPPVLQYGRVMKGYAAVPEALLNDEPALAGWFERMVANARALKPKPTKRKRVN